MATTIQSREELVEQAGPVEECERCQSKSTVKIDGLCVLHYVTMRYDLGEIKTAYREFEEHAEIREKAKESLSRFRQRAEEAFPERRIHIMAPRKEILDGENIAWFTNKRQYGRRPGDIFHTDTSCPHFPSGSLVASPVPYARTWTPSKPCSYCVYSGDSDGR